MREKDDYGRWDHYETQRQLRDLRHTTRRAAEAGVPHETDHRGEQTAVSRYRDRAIHDLEILDHGILACQILDGRAEASASDLNAQHRRLDAAVALL